ncbi:MAG: ABC transporter permease [archaeon]
MKFTKTIAKNLKLLMRAKSSAFIVIFGPLIIILLVSLALNKPSTYDLSVSYYSPDQNNPLTESFIEELRNSEYFMLEHDSEISCIEAIEQGSAHTCIVFPKDFEVGNDVANKVTFFVDYSRANLVYQIIDAVSKKLEIRSTELSKGLTDVLLTKIMETRQDVDKNVLSMITLKSTLDTIISDIEGTKASTEEFEISMEDISISNLNSLTLKIYEDADELETLGMAAVDEGLDIATTNTSITFFETKETEINDVFNDTHSNYEIADSLIDNVTEQIESQAEVVEEKSQEIISDLAVVQGSLGKVKTTSDEVKADLEDTLSNLEDIDIANAESIVSPIKTEIKPVVAESNQLIFMFPFLLVLVIMFIAIMLSSTLIVMEKKSKAAFRNFTTPTKERFFIFTTFITSFIILFLQVIVILLLSYYFLKTEIFANAGLTSLILLITMTMFVLLGMIIGYLSRTQESATMLSITFGSVFLLLSNLILPIETMSNLMKNLTKFNPYVMSSELLKRTMLFEVKFTDILSEIIFLVIIMAILVVITLMVNKLSRMKLLERNPYFTKRELIYVPEDAYLKIDKYIIKSKQDILKTLRSMSAEEFNTHVKKKNEIANWVNKTLKERRLAWKLRFKSKEKMILVMQKYLKKKEKKEEKKRKKAEKD